MTDKEVKYKVLFSGDTHLSSRNYGGHFDYPKESLYYFEQLNKIAKEHNVTHDIRLGDFTFGKFHDLQYRADVEEQLRIANEQVNGNLYILKGNHDVSSTGMTEYEFYLKSGWFRGAENITLDNVNISMLNYGEHLIKNIIPPSSNTIDIVAGHGYFKFADTNLPNYGIAFDLDNKQDWFGVDLIILGHIHKFHKFKGLIVKDNIGHPTVVEYLNCPCRPSYLDDLDTTWHLFILSIFTDNSVSVEEIEVPLLPIEECFNIDKIREEKIASMQKKIDMKDIIQRVGSYTSSIGDPEIIINNMIDVEQKYRDKALELLKD